MSKRLTAILRDAEKDIHFHIDEKQFEVSLALRERLLDLEISQAQFARKLGVSEPAVSKLLRGTENHTIAKLVEVADALGMEVRIQFVEKPAERARRKPVFRSSMKRELQHVFEPTPWLRSPSPGEKGEIRAVKWMEFTPASNQEICDEAEPAAA